MAALVFFASYHSVYFKKLDQVKLESAAGNFDAGSYANDFYHNKLIPHLDSAIETGRLVALLQTDPAEAFRKYSHALAIGNIRYFLVRGEAVISQIKEDAISLGAASDTTDVDAKIITEFVYGSAIRDASGLLSLNEFSSTSDFNGVAEEINKIVRKQVLPPFLSKAKPGNTIQYAGAIELNQAHLNLDSIEIVPIRLSIISQPVTN